MSRAAARVLFVGLDGGAKSVLDAGFERGWFPNLSALWKRSAHGILRSSDPMVTPVAWTSFSTGSDPADHGIHEFYSIDPIDRSIHHNDSNDVRVPTIWQALGDSGREIVSMNLPMTYPAPRAPGIVVSGSDAPNRKSAFLQCPEFAAELADLAPDYTNAIIWKRRPQRFDELEALARRNCAVFRAQAQAALLADQRSDWSAMMVHYHNLDSLQHRLWPYLDVDQTAANEPEWSKQVVTCLRALDESIGVLLELASKREAAVVVASDHGFGPCKALVNVNGLLRAGGFQRPMSLGSRVIHRAHRLGDRFKRWLARRTPGGLARRSSRSILGQVGCDWKRTVAFAPFGQLSGNIFLSPDFAKHESKADRVKRELIEWFKDATDPNTGDRLFRHVYDVAERQGVDPRIAGCADVLALSADGYQAQAKWSRSKSDVLLLPDYNLPATHYLEGVTAIDAPDVNPGRLLAADLRDLAPTALAILDEPIPQTMTGRVIHEAFHTPLPVRRTRALEPDVVGAAAHLEV